MTNDKLEIFSVDSLTENRQLADELYAFGKRWGIELGWHYILDLLWILAELGPIQPGMQVLDAGAGFGLMQWWLAEHGAHVISVDKVSRAEMSVRFYSRYHLKGMRPGDLYPRRELAARRLDGTDGVDPAGALRALASIPLSCLTPKAEGSVTFYNQDLARLDELNDGSMDAIVAVSSLEHNSMEAFPGVYLELMRVLKPGGVLLASLGASAGEDWYHEPSSGWCYSEASLRNMYHLEADAVSNYERHDELFEKIRSCDELRRNLAPFYRTMPNSGMPGGVWDPQYQPVGVRKVKPERE
ncbi:MAG: class I SAM-dependent methyltransferase [Anaerolineales bacterium]|nr:class I SAM-dependent methyltransferase [Anaerolineales bacterium]